MSQSDDIKHKVMSSLAWLGGMKYLGQIITWAITIVVIRILNPEDYGLMAMANVCVNLLFMLCELGLGAAIVQQKEVSKYQLSQIFGFIILVNGLITLIFYYGALIIAYYFADPRLILILRVLCINLILMTLYVIPQSMLLRRMKFREKSIVDFAGTIIAAVVTLVVALNGGNVWALVWGAITTHIVYLIGYNILYHTIHIPKFHFKGLKGFMTFGGFTTGSRLLWYFYSKADIFIGGHFLGNKAIGIYSVALELASIPLDKFIPVLNQVAFPAYSKIQADIKLVQTNFLKTIRLVSFLIFPSFWGLFVIAPDLLQVLLGPKWDGAIFPMQILCVMMPFRALSTLMNPALNGIGRADISFKIVLIAALIMPLSFYIGVVTAGIKGLCFAWLFGYSITFLIVAKISLKALGLNLFDLFLSIKESLIISFCMAASLLMLKEIYSNFSTLFVEIIIYTSGGIIIYIGLFYLFKRNQITEFKNLFIK